MKAISAKATRGLNLGAMMIASDNSGAKIVRLVSVKRAKVDGMKDFMVFHISHPFIMRDHKTIRQTIAFLKNGKFTRE